MDSAQFRSVEAWERRISESHFPLLMNAARPDFKASISTVDLPRGMRISEIDVESNHLKRTEHLVRTQPSDHVLVVLQQSGKAVIRQLDRQVVLENGSGAIADPNAPYEIKMTRGSHQLVLLLPEASLRAGGAKVSEVRTKLLPADSLAIRSLSSLARDLVVTDIAPEEAEGLAAAAFDLLRGALGRLGTLSLTVASASHEAQRRLVKEYIQGHLENPGLSVESVAKSHHISPRHLATLFGPESTPGAYIRQARLQRIFDDLTNPSMQSLTASQIASRWGFTNYPTLSRAFRRQFGVAPNEARVYGREALDSVR
ncbi:helix-turn-helix domain-containing protein [Arthrobacter sp. KNU40]|uniref:AraC-like ligand-binding domain-containing protein n=1 Tax=Arthrobacter sp. KNU40 TaxID=3447965 RepID=UPI003F5F5A0E